MNTTLRTAAVLSLSLSASTQAETTDSQCHPVAPGECLQVTTSGAGPNVVLVPGLFGSAFGFRRLVPLLVTAGYRTIVIEPLGVGSSSRPRNADYTMTAQADRIHEVLRAKGAANSVVISHAVGTSIALRLAYRHPSSVRAVVSIEGGPAEELATPGLKRAMTFVPLLKLFGGTGIIRGKVRGMLVERSAHPAWVTDAVVNGYTEGAAKDMDATLDALKAMSRAREPEALARNLPKVLCPVRLLLGAAPHPGGPSDMEIRLFQNSLKSFDVVRVPHSGHFIFEEAPQAIVNALTELVGAPTTGIPVEN